MKKEIDVTFRRAITSVGLGLAISLGGASSAHAATYQWWNAGKTGYLTAGGSAASGTGTNIAFTGFAQTSSYTVAMQYYTGGGSNMSGVYSAKGNECLAWSTPQPNLGVLIENPHSFGQYMTSWVDTAGSYC